MGKVEQKGDSGGFDYIKKGGVSKSKCTVQLGDVCISHGNIVWS